LAEIANLRNELADEASKHDRQVPHYILHTSYYVCARMYCSTTVFRVHFMCAVRYSMCN
jgi:hypothetical protein